MVNFTKIFGLASAAFLFAGLAAAQDCVTAPSVTPSTVFVDRGEGTTELLPQFTISCTGNGVASPPVGAPNTTPGQVTLQLFFSLPITSKNVGGTFTEAEVQSNGVAPGNVVLGVVTGSTITFSGISVPANGFTLVVSNIRVNASGAGVVAGGSPVPVTGSFLIGGPPTVVTPAYLALPNLALLLNGLAPSAVGTSNATTLNNKFTNPPVCQSNSGGALAEYIQVNEGYPAAFKNAAGEASSVAVVGTTTSNAVVDGTRVQITFANVPQNVNIYVPVAGVASLTGGDVLTYTPAGPGTPFFPGTGTFPTTTQTTGLLLPALSLIQVPISSGTGTAVFEETTVDNTTSGKFNIPIYYVNSAFAVPAGTTSGITAEVSLSPIGSSVIPNFSLNSQTTFTTGTFTLCNTTLLFPFVTNQSGFDTGLAIANTTTDPLGNSGATPQSGACTLSFYGGSTATPSYTTPSVATGTVWTNTLSGVAGGFQGYMISVCNFENAHAFVFITDGVGATGGGLSQGYLAGVIPGARGNNETLGF